MNEAIASAIGGEKGDQTIRATTSALRPLWTLIPLPLSQIDPSIGLNLTHRSAPKSLQHTCLAVISRNFHTYTPTSFENISSTLLDRIFHKVRHDRQYDFDLDEARVQPDQATIWALCLFADPEVADGSHTLALPVDVTLQHLVPRPTFANPIHPFIEIPNLYASLQPGTPYTLITTLHLDGMNDLVTDHNITSLKFATNLTVLRMLGCRRVTDSGIRLLVASLELPGRIGGDGEGRGMWKLRAWYLQRCKAVTDKSMSSFARWPGLILLDVRNTSCSTMALSIFNRYSESVFSSTLARMQQCSNGLRELFGFSYPSSHLVKLLALTLLQPDDGLPKRPIPFRSLNLIPSSAPPLPEHLPNPPPTSTLRWQPSRTESTAYLTGGVGQLYGSGVGSMPDELRSFRKDVETALYMQALDEGLHKDPKPDKEDRWWEKKKAKKPKVIKEKAVKASGDRSKQFVAGAPHSDLHEANHAQGRGELMMVRVAQEGWEKLTWAVGGAGGAAKAEVKTGRGKDLVGDILSSTANPRSKTSPPVHVSSSKPSGIKLDPPVPTLFRPISKPKPPLLPASRASATAPLLPAPPRTSSNPFSTPSQRSSNAFGVQPLSSSPAEPTSSAESNGFGTSGKKRTWGGVSDEGAKRRGMKMFSGARM